MVHLEAVSEAILESKTGSFHETLWFSNFGKSTELLLCGLLNERAMRARKMLKNKTFMLSEVILERNLQKKPFLSSENM